MSEKSEMEQGANLLLPEPKGELVPVGDTSQALALPEGLNLPKLITDGGEKATLRFINLFTAEIENDNTRMAYYRAVRQFDAWCENARGLLLKRRGVRAIVGGSVVATPQQAKLFQKEGDLSFGPAVLTDNLFGKLRREFDDFVVDADRHSVFYYTSRHH